MRALVTGGIGFIRTNPSDRLLRDGHGVVLFDNVSRTGVQLNFDWLKGQLTLGISYSQMHDSSACIVRDGELLFAVAEERISRAKHDARFPGESHSGAPEIC
jgi:nucleoside-diphosphate-sugar epimerase